MTLLPVPVSELTSTEQLFRCARYSAILTVATCLARQSGHGSSVAISAWGRDNPDKVAPHATRRRWYGGCGACEQGRAVRAAVEAGQ